jgi:hypothetical protein
MVVSETEITEVSEILIQTEVSEIVTADLETQIMVASEIPTQMAVSETHNPMVDSVILHHRQDLIIIISNHSLETTIVEASDLMIREVSDLAAALTPVEAASEEGLLAAAE